MDAPLQAGIKLELLRIQPFGWFTCSSIRPTLSAHTQALRAAPSVRGAGRGLRARDLLCNCAFCVASIVQTIYTASTIVPPSLSDLSHPLKQIACSQGSLTPVLMVVHHLWGQSEFLLGGRYRDFPLSFADFPLSFAHVSGGRACFRN